MDRGYGGKRERAANDRSFAEERHHEEMQQLDHAARPNVAIHTTVPAWINDILRELMVGGKKRTVVVQAALIEWAMSNYPTRVPKG